MRKIEFVESYIKTDDGDYRWNDNHGELIRCKDCKYAMRHPQTGNLTICNHPSNNGWNICDEGYCWQARRRTDESD